MIYHTPEQISEEAKKLIAEYLLKIDDMKAKERTKIPPQEMPAQDPESVLIIWKKLLLATQWNKRASKLCAAFSA